ncbi:zinc metalloprotease [Paenibacillus odorifer]|uniref:M48 family metallopeptidase n=1 Tax=Paenibacillus odorifer TaxID=189426 RepID=UPI00096C2CC2|nr:SprT family zinc-dependent metalloprotease [Paenibacillus odorifer]OMD62995.1 zinc metalloprotease [Paenibacillus odorifer]
MATFNFGTKNITYNLHHKAYKTDITVTVDWTNGVNVVVPEHITQEELEKVLHKKAPWILKKMYEFNEIKMFTPEKEFLSGEKFPYLGRHYRLKVTAHEKKSDVSLMFKKGCFLATIPKDWNDRQRQKELKELLQQWYFLHGEIKLRERLNLYSPKMECYPSKLVLKEQEMRWGSCTKNGTVNINWLILMAPMRIVDYVLVHELAHLKHPDHSPAFWATIQSILPDYESRKEWLRVHGPTLTF